MNSANMEGYCANTDDAVSLMPIWRERRGQKYLQNDATNMTDAICMRRNNAGGDDGTLKCKMLAVVKYEDYDIKFRLFTPYREKH